MSWKFNPFTGTFDQVGTGGNSTTPLDRTEVEVTAGETISALKAVFIDDDNLAYLANRSSYKTSKVLGIAITAATAGNPLTVVTFGAIVDVSFTGPTSDPFYLHSSGSISTSEPVSTGTLTRIGYSLGVGSLFVKIEEPILRG